MSNYIIDPFFEFGQPPPPATRNAWVELGRTTLAVPASDISVVVPKKRWLMVIMRSTGNPFDVNMFLRFNGDNGNNYASRVNSNGGVDLASTSVSAIIVGGDNDFDPDFAMAYIDNNPVGEKLVIAHDCEQALAGSNIPNRRESVGKWSNLTDQITTVTLSTITAQVWNVGSEVIVLGFDPNDGLEAPANFWQPLAGVTLSANNVQLSSGVFTSKKYLWVEAFTVGTLGTSENLFRVGNTTIDVANNYSDRFSRDGGADAGFAVTSRIDSSKQQDDNKFTEFLIVNEQTREKLAIGHTVLSSTVGPANATQRQEMVGKWNNVASQIDIVAFDTLGAYGVGSQIKVWGHD